jgi:hypothetical protein
MPVHIDWGAAMAARRIRSTRGARVVLAATGLAVSAAATGGLGAVTAGASAPAKIYACYSDTTDALSYLN